MQLSLLCNKSEVLNVISSSMPPFDRMFYKRWSRTGKSRAILLPRMVDYYQLQVVKSRTISYCSGWIYLWVHKPIHEQFNHSRSINRDCNLNRRFIRPFSDFSKPGLKRWVSGSSMKMLWQTTESSKKPMFRM